MLNCGKDSEVYIMYIIYYHENHPDTGPSLWANIWSRSRSPASDFQLRVSMDSVW